MRRKLHTLLVVAVAGLAAHVSTVGATSPPLRAQHARARAVLAQVNALDLRSGHVVDAWDGAQIQLAASKRELAANRVALERARHESRVADQRLAQRLVAIYESGEPGLVDVLAGASTLSNLIDRLEASKTIAGYDRRLAEQAQRSKTRLAAARLRIGATERKRRSTLARLGAERRQIGTMLTHRRRLLSSIESEIATIKAREARRQQALAAEARARLAREQALLERQAAARAAAQRAERAQSAPPATAPSPAAPAPVAPQTGTIPTTGSATTAPTTTAAPPPTLGAGHPEAATIALRYLGIPYQWGGASPSTGFDCSGLVMYVYEQLGIKLPHQAAAQFGYGAPVPRDQLQPGDLVFFDGLSHVGIYIGGGEIVHAPHTGDVVKISPLTEFANYVGARRL